MILSVFQDHDIIAIRVKNPINSSVTITPFPLLSYLPRKSLLEEKKEFCIVHMLPTSGILGKPKVAVGPKYSKETANKGHCKL